MWYKKARPKGTTGTRQDISPSCAPVPSAWRRAQEKGSLLGSAQHAGLHPKFTMPTPERQPRLAEKKKKSWQ